MPNIIQQEINEDPPALTKGKVMPVVGKRPRATARLIKVWEIIKVPTPRAMVRPKGSRVLAHKFKQA